MQEEISKEYAGLCYKIVNINIRLAQGSEQNTHNVWVGGSIPSSDTIKYWRIAQLVERRAVNSNVVGSSPTPSAKIVNI